MMEHTKNYLGGDITAYTIDFGEDYPATDEQMRHKSETGFETFSGPAMLSLDADGISEMLDSKDIVENYEFVSYPLA